MVAHLMAWAATGETVRKCSLPYSGPQVYEMVLKRALRRNGAKARARLQEFADLELVGYHDTLRPAGLPSYELLGCSRREDALIDHVQLSRRLTGSQRYLRTVTRGARR